MIHSARTPPPTCAQVPHKTQPKGVHGQNTDEQGTLPYWQGTAADEEDRRRGLEVPMQHHVAFGSACRSLSTPATVRIKAHPQVCT